MPKVKTHRKKPTLDMTPVVDLAFLLVTFFMLTTQFRPEEPVVVDMPSSTDSIMIPNKDIITITVAKDGRVLFDVDNKNVRKTLIGKMNEKFTLNLTEDEMNTFAILSSFGVPLGGIKQYLNMEAEERKSNNIGIPTDSLNNQLSDWVMQARLSNPKVRIAIKGDGQASYPVVKRVMGTLQEQKVNRFNLITTLEKGS